MLGFNRRRNTLEQEDYRYLLQDVDTPVLYRDVFPYDKVPKVCFNHRQVPMNPPDEIWITCTTFRDGQQSRPPYTVDQIVTLYKMMHRLGGKGGVIRQCEFFLYTERDREAVRKCQELGYRYPEITGWIRARKQDFSLVKQMGLKETGILTSASDYHIFLKLKKSRRQAMQDYLDIARAALDEGIIPRCHFEDITRADIYGFVIPFAQQLMRLSEEYKMPVKIRACDTLGYGVTYPGVSLPRSVRGIIYGLTHHAGVPSEWLEWHGHNDFYRAFDNAVTAWLFGCSAANGTLLGIGERTGNTPIEALVVELIALRGEQPGVDLTVLGEIAEYYEKEIGYTIPPNQPLVGKHFNVTSAGIHADGLMKNEEIYNIFDTKALLNRPPGVVVTDRTGVAGIAQWINTEFRLVGEEQVPKNHPSLLEIKKAVDAQYAEGRTTSMSDEEMHALVEKFMPELIEKTKK